MFLLEASSTQVIVGSCWPTCSLGSPLKTNMLPCLMLRQVPLPSRSGWPLVRYTSSNDWVSQIGRQAGVPWRGVIPPAPHAGLASMGGASQATGSGWCRKWCSFRCRLTGKDQTLHTRHTGAGTGGAAKGIAVVPRRVALLKTALVVPQAAGTIGGPDARGSARVSRRCWGNCTTRLCRRQCRRCDSFGHC